MGTVSVPLTAALADERNFLNEGDQVAFLGIGSGLNCHDVGFPMVMNLPVAVENVEHSPNVLTKGQHTEYLGNMGTVSVPLTAALAHERGFLSKGDQVAFLGIGSGLNCMMLGFEW